MSKEPQKSLREEIALRALNEHGFLLQNRISELLLAKPIGEWRLKAVEFPISFDQLEDETRVDLVLTRHVAQRNTTWHIPIECKRPNPQFKTWLFFNTRERVLSERHRRAFIESHELQGGWNCQGEPPLLKLIGRIGVSEDMLPEVFTFYVEARENPPDRRDSASSTKAMEDAFHQVTLGSVGLGRELQRLQNLNYRLLPVVLTTAELCACEFPVDSIDLASGTLAADKLKLRPLDWACVNYAIGERLASAAELSATRGRSLSDALSYRLLRSVFVVHTTKIEAFLKWVDKLVETQP